MKKYFIVALLGIILDQIIKAGITKYFVFSKNFGAAFGILQNQTTLIILLSFFAIGFLIYYVNKVKGYGSYALGLVFAGIIGNLIDRMTYGYVIDYIKILHYPAFNLADVFLVSGVVILILYLRKNE